MVRVSRRTVVRGLGASAMLSAVTGLLGSCGAPPPGGLSGTILIDGSSTVAPITQAVAEEFQAKFRGVRVPVGVSGTGGGFKKFCRGEVEISGASRPIKPSEVEFCARSGIEYIELPVAFDGLAVMVNPANDFVECLTVEELRTIWEPDAEERIVAWAQVRDGFPDQPLTLYGPGVDSGTYDYFTKAVVGQSGASRGDFTPSEDDNVLVQGVAGDANALGFFGLAYYEANRARLKLVKINGGDGCVAPTLDSVKAGVYQPLARPIFIYVNRAVAERADVKAFVRFYLDQATVLAAEVGYVPLTDDLYRLVLRRFERPVTGTVFADDAADGRSLGELLRAGF